jgi:thiol-disulfide isomerase/thioredoxin
LAADEENSSAPSTAADLLKNPDNDEALNAFLTAQFRAIGQALSDDVAAAETQLKELASILEKLQPTTDDAKSLLARARSAVQFYTGQVELARVTREDLEKLLSERPDTDTLRKWVQKVSGEISALASSEPEAAEKKLAAAKEFSAKLAAGTGNEAIKSQISQLSAGPRSAFVALEGRIAAGRKLAAVIGRDAPPLEVEAWVNGTPLSDADLKGKVVLLDFWAIWCGPCIATFPHLREWHEKYADRGLVIIGLTRYYEYEWDDATQRPRRATTPVTPEAEQEMLKKFAEFHSLKHRFAIREGSELSEFYGVTGIPHVAVIDQRGKVRLMRVGSGPQNAADISRLLAELLPDPAAERK